MATKKEIVTHPATEYLCDKYRMEILEEVQDFLQERVADILNNDDELQEGDYEAAGDLLDAFESFIAFHFKKD